MNFDVQNITTTTFYGFFDDGHSEAHIQIPIDGDVATELARMIDFTIDQLLPQPPQPPQPNQVLLANLPIFDPAEKYASVEQLKLPLLTDYIQDLQNVIALRNLPSDVNALANANDLEYYYAIFEDNQGRLLYAFKRASRFKGIKKSVLTYIAGGALTLMNTPIFRLDSDFDYFVDCDSNTIYILRPSGFEFTTNVHGEIMRSATLNGNQIQATLPYIDLTSVIAYASSHSKSARLLSAIKSRIDLAHVDRVLLTTACNENGVATTINPTGQLVPNAGEEYNFLCILDRRAYTSTLITNQPENYIAASRARR